MAESAPISATLRPRPIDAAARNGRAQLLSDGESFALGRWDGDRWVYPLTTMPIEISPTEVCL